MIQNDKVLWFISTYKPNNSSMFSKVEKMYASWKPQKLYAKPYTKHELINCKRQPSNLRRLLFFKIFIK